MVSVKVFKPRSGQDAVREKRWACSLSPRCASRLDVSANDHVRIEDGEKALCCRVREIHEKDEYPLRVSEKTRDSTGLEHHAEVTVRKQIPGESYMKARRTGDLAETVWDDLKQSQILVYAPHGGDTEFGTDDAAIRLYRKLQNSGFDCSLWALHGFNPNSFARWHVSKPGLTSGCYPGLDQVKDRTYDLVVSFHVQSKGYTGIGGAIDESFRKRVAEEMDSRIRDRYEFRWRHSDMRWKGVSDSNVVNKLARDGGLQIEMQPIIGYKYRKKAVESAHSVIKDRL